LKLREATPSPFVSICVHLWQTTKSSLKAATTTRIAGKSMPKARDTRFRGAGGRFGTTHNGTTEISEALDAYSAEVIRRFFRRADRYASVYRQGATGLLAEYAVKEHRSHAHRSVTAQDLTLAQEEKEKRDAILKQILTHK